MIELGYTFGEMWVVATFQVQIPSWMQGTTVVRGMAFRLYNLGRNLALNDRTPRPLDPRLQPSFNWRWKHGVGPNVNWRAA